MKLPENAARTVGAGRSTSAPEWDGPVQPDLAAAALHAMDQLAERANSLADRVGIKLLPFSVPPTPCTPEAAERTPEFLPPFYAEMRDRFGRFHNILNAIEDALSRASTGM